MLVDNVAIVLRERSYQSVESTLISPRHRSHSEGISSAFLFIEAVTDDVEVRFQILDIILDF
jgi:hypothetical protein